MRGRQFRYRIDPPLQNRLAGLQIAPWKDAGRPEAHPYRSLSAEPGEVVCSSSESLEELIVAVRRAIEILRESAPPDILREANKLADNAEMYFYK